MPTGLSASMLFVSIKSGSRGPESTTLSPGTLKINLGIYLYCGFRRNAKGGRAGGGGGCPFKNP